MIALSDARKFDVTKYEEKAFVKIYSINSTYNKEYVKYQNIKLTPVNRYTSTISFESDILKPYEDPTVNMF